MTIGIVAVWIALSIAVAVGANARGRSGAGWFFLSILLSPLIAGFMLLVLGQYRPAYSFCPSCREKVDPKATICPHCRMPIEPGAIKRQKHASEARFIVTATTVIVILVAIVFYFVAQ